MAGQRLRGRAPDSLRSRTDTGSSSRRKLVREPNAAGGVLRSASHDFLARQAPSPRSPRTKTLAAPSSRGRAGGGRGEIGPATTPSRLREEERGDLRPPTAPAPRARVPLLPPRRHSSSSITRAWRRFVSTDHVPTDRSAETLSARSVLIATALRVVLRQQPKDSKHLKQQERGRKGRGRSRRGVRAASSPPLTQRVRSDASPRIGGDGGGGRGGGARRSFSSDSVRRGGRLSPSASVERSSDIKYNSSDAAEASTGEEHAANTTTTIITTTTPTATPSTKRFYDYWSYYNITPSTTPSGTRETIDEILSQSLENDLLVSPSSLIAVDTTSTTRARPTTATNCSRGSTVRRSHALDAAAAGGGTASGDDSASGSDGTTVSTGGRMVQRAAGASARAARAAAAEWQAMQAKRRLRELRSHSGNSRCADCGGPCADWASVAYGSFVCLKCAGKHRSLGMLVAFTLSLVMDGWTERNLRLMEVGGNKRLAEFAQRVGLHPLSSVEDKYSHPCLRLYREHLGALADGEEPPPLSRTALEQALLAAIGEEASSYDNSDGDRSETASGKCCRVGHDLGLWSCVPAASRRKERSFAVAAGGVGGPPRWVPDDEKEACMLCQRQFSLVIRRHHCRRCGRLSCKFCAPAENTRPILEWGFTEAVRHCRVCYRSPLLEWPDRPTG